MSTTVHVEVFTKLSKTRWCNLTQAALREQLTLIQSGGDKHVAESSMLLGVNAHLKPTYDFDGRHRDWYMDQDYHLFSHLAGVRNGQRGPVVEKPIFELNGYPKWYPGYVNPNDSHDLVRDTGVGSVGFCTPREFLCHEWPAPLMDHFSRYQVERGMFVWAPALELVYGSKNTAFVFVFSL